MDESTKTKAHWTDLDREVLSGSGIDIGCGPDPVSASVERFDLEHGDANHITRHVQRQFDFVYASHCLEHMHDPRAAILEWWKLVRPGGHLYFLVPDEDLYEQGVFPSRFNPDHKATFTLSKQKSWSPVSISVLELAQSLPCGRIRRLVLQDQGYDRSRMKHGPENLSPWPWFILKLYRGLRRRGLKRIPALEAFEARHGVIDQTYLSPALAQIQCIVQKLPAST